MKKPGKVAAVFMAACMTAALAMGCSPSTSESSQSSEPAKTEQSSTSEDKQSEEPAKTEASSTDTQAADASSVTVIDGGGRTVTIDQPVDEILTVYGSKYVLALGLGDKMVNGSDGEFELAVCPSLADGITFTGQDMNVETVANIKPDIFIHASRATELLDAVQEMGIPAVGLYMETPDEIVDTLRLMGTALGAEERAEEVINYYEDLMAVGGELTADIPEDQKHTAILMGSTIGKVADGSMLQSVMIESAGGINLAKDVETEGSPWPTVGVEQIFDWDPEYIFLMNSNPRDYDVESLMADPAWQDLQAIQNGNVYVVPSDLDSWEYPGIGSALGTIWMTSKMYPELMSDEQLEQYVNDFYQDIYGVSFTREQLNY